MLHVFNTWVLANLLYSLFVFLFSGDVGGEWFPSYDISFYLLGLVFLFIISLPLLIASWFLFYFIRKASLRSGVKFGAWVFFAAALPAIEWILFYLFKDRSEIYPEEVETFLPAPAAVLISILIRYKQFFAILKNETIKHLNSD